MRKKEGNKREAILEAAIQGFAQYGYHNSKVAKIAESAGVATGSVYVYFEDKEDLLVKIFDELWEDLYNNFKNLNSIKGKNEFEKIESMIDIFFDMFTSDSGLAKVYVNEQNFLQFSRPEKFTKFYGKFFELGEKILREGKRNGTISKDLDIKIFRYFLIGGIRLLLHQWALDSRNFGLTKIKKNLKSIIKNGIVK